MTSAVLSIGTNLGDRLAYLRLATEGLGARLRAASAVYETAPWGVTEQPAFLNAVLLVEDETYGPYDWLAAAREFEAAAERVRTQRWGPRTLDVDVIAVDERTQSDPELILPHPCAHERAFVLVPWLEVDPAATLPGLGTVAALVDALGESERTGVVRRAELELA